MKNTLTEYIVVALIVVLALQLLWLYIREVIWTYRRPTRDEWELLPTNNNAPTEAQVEAYAQELAGSSPMTLKQMLIRPSIVVRHIHQNKEQSSQTRTTIELPRGHKPPAIPGIEPRMMSQSERLARWPQKAQATRVELRLRTDYSRPIKQHHKLDPDPKEPIYMAYDEIPHGYEAQIITILKPVRRAWRRKALEAVKKLRGEPNQLERIHREVTGKKTKLATPSRTTLPTVRAIEAKAQAKIAFNTQLLVRCAHIPTDTTEELIAKRTCKKVMGSLLRALEAMTNDALNGMKTSRVRLLLNNGLLKHQFDRRVAWGIHLPGRKNILTPLEIGPLILPATSTDGSLATHVKRQTSPWGKPSRRFKTYTPTGKLIPHGITRDGKVLGIPPNAQGSRLTLGATRHGKSYRLEAAAISVARLGYGVAYIDPPGTSCKHLKNYLWGIDQEIVEIHPSSTKPQLGFNPLDVSHIDDVPDAVSRISEAFGVTYSWSDRSTPRTFPLFKQTIQALCEANLKLPREVRITLFQIPRFLMDAEFRDLILHQVNKSTQEYFGLQFPAIESQIGALGPINSKIDDLERDVRTRCLFGQSRSAFRFAELLNSGAFVLIDLAEAHDQVEILGRLFLFEIWRAASARTTMSRDDMNPFIVFADEAKNYVSRTMERIVTEAAKFKLYPWFAAQSPMQLDEYNVLERIRGNWSIFETFWTSKDKARLIADEFKHSAAGAQVTDADIVGLKPYEFYSRVDLGAAAGGKQPPFKLRGIDIEGDPHFKGLFRKDLADKVQEMALSRGPRTPEQVQTHQDVLVEQIMDHLRNGGKRSSRRYA